MLESRTNEKSTNVASKPIRAHSPGEVRAADGTRRVDERLTDARVKSARTI